MKLATQAYFFHIKFSYKLRSGNLRKPTSKKVNSLSFLMLLFEGLKSTTSTTKLNVI